MIVIPAIDLKDGLCVRLLQGRIEAVTVYSDDPIAIAKKWEACGANLLHVVDLDGAFTGTQKNLDAIIKIRKAVKIDIEVGGGVRDIERIDMLISVGINKVIIGTASVEDPQFVRKASEKYPGKILVGIDAKNSLVAVRGWENLTKIKAKEFALKVQDWGIAGVIYTDISKDGMMKGPNVEAIAEMVQSLKIPVIASGGVSSLDDIKKLKSIKNLFGVITGKALYEGAFDLKDAIKIAEAA